MGFMDEKARKGTDSAISVLSTKMDGRMRTEARRYRCTDGSTDGKGHRDICEQRRDGCADGYMDAYTICRRRNRSTDEEPDGLTNNRG